ncbi:MAG: hypothetical protein ACI959_000935 [Limisphaerales bacterium]|jgi:hypothetical protein
MNTMWRHTIGLLLILVLPMLTQAQNSADLSKISSAIKNGNAKALSDHFDNSVEITILDKESTYSKSQAAGVVKNFFARNAPESFQIIHKGDSGGDSKYAIGKLSTSEGTFRTYIYVKRKGGVLLIQQLRFERE